MELHQLRYFLAVVDEGTFTAAAKAVRVSQSGISTQVQKLERELGLSLVDRSSRRVTLTPAGTRLLPYARAAIGAVDDVAHAANDIRGLVTGSLRVATVTGLAWEPLFEALATVHAQHPGIDLRLCEGVSDDLIGSIRSGDVDVGVVAWSHVVPQGVSTSIIVDDPLVVVVGTDHPWAGRQRVRPAELAEVDLIALPAGTGARSALDVTAARAATPLTPRWEVATPAYVEALVSRGVGVGVVSATTAEGWHHVVAVPVADPQARSRLGIVWQQNPSHAATALLRELNCCVN